MNKNKTHCSELNNGIQATVVAHSTCDSGVEIVTLNVRYWLAVHSEFLRHRTISRGVKSNRAIPAKTIRKEVLQDPYIPVFLGANQRGMQSKSEMKHKWLGIALWKAARYPACAIHWLLEKCGAHKEWVNRLLNPWQWVSETITATDWNNLYTLRLDDAAQRDIKEVVLCIKNAIEENRAEGTMQHLNLNQWHTPYVHQVNTYGVQTFIDNDGNGLSVQQALECSAARCARSSYNKHDGGLTTHKEDKILFDTLMQDNPKHASPVEHQATPICENEESLYEDGVTHYNVKTRQVYSGNLRGWIQHRQLIQDNVAKEESGNV